MSTSVMGNKLAAPADSTADSGASRPTPARRRRTKGPSEKLRSLAALSLAPKLAYLKLNALIEPDNAELQVLINQQLPSQTFKAGSTIHPGTTATPVLFIVKSGSVNLSRVSPTGSRFSIKGVGPGTIFGEMPLFGQSMLGVHADAAETCEVLLVDERRAEQMLLASPDLALSLLRQIGPRLVETDLQHEQAAFQPVTARVASLLLRSADASGQVVGFTHQEIADTLGVYRETVTNALAELKQDHLIEIGRKRIMLRDRDALIRLASF